MHDLLYLFLYFLSAWVLHVFFHFAPPSCQKLNGVPQMDVLLWYSSAIICTNRVANHVPILFHILGMSPLVGLGIYINAQGGI